MRGRKFGVELEFSSNGLEIEGVARLLRNAFDKKGYRRWHFGNRMSHDGSDIELATPPLRGPEGFKKLEFVMSTLEKAGCYCTEEDGMHVHHDAPEYVNNIDNCISLVKSWKRNQHLIWQFVSEERHYDWSGHSHWACPEWSEGDINHLVKHKEIPGWSRNDLNLHTLNRYGTVEIRLHEGTLNYREAESWIQFGQAFLDRSAIHTMRESKDATNLLKKIKVNPNAEKVLTNKARYG